MTVDGLGVPKRYRPDPRAIPLRGGRWAPEVHVECWEGPSVEDQLIRVERPPTFSSREDALAWATEIAEGWIRGLIATKSKRSD